MDLYRDLSIAEENEFRQWARENYHPSEEINPVWHPVVRDECEKMQMEDAGRI